MIHLNKLLVFPLAFMFIITIFSLVYVGGTYSSDTNNYSEQTGIEVPKEGSGSTNATVKIPQAKQQTFDISTAQGIMLILTVAVAVGIIAGIKILGSGLSDISQSMIFTGLLFGGLWACLSIVSATFLFDTIITLMLWSIITIMYIIGMGIHLSGSGSDA